MACLEQSSPATGGPAHANPADAWLAKAFEDLWRCPSSGAIGAFAACGGVQEDPGPERRARGNEAVSMWARARFGVGVQAFLCAIITGDRRLAKDAADILNNVSKNILAAAPPARWWSQQRFRSETDRRLAAECAALGNFAGMLKAIMQFMSLQYAKAIFTLRGAFSGLRKCHAEVDGTPAASYAFAGQAAVLLTLSMAPRHVQRMTGLAGLWGDRAAGLRLLNDAGQADGNASIAYDSRQWPVLLLAMWHLHAAVVSRFKDKSEVRRADELADELLSAALQESPDNILLTWVAGWIQQSLSRPEAALQLMQQVQRLGAPILQEGHYMPRIDFGTAMLLLKQRRFEEAAKLFGDAADPKRGYNARGMSLTYLGAVQLYLGKRSEAHASWEEIRQLSGKGMIDRMLGKKTEVLATRQHGIVCVVELLYLLGGRLHDLSETQMSLFEEELTSVPGCAPPAPTPSRVDGARTADADQAAPGAPASNQDSLAEEQLTAWFLAGVLARRRGYNERAEAAFLATMEAAAAADVRDAYHGPYAHFELALLAFSQGHYGAATKRLDTSAAAVEEVRRRRAADPPPREDDAPEAERQLRAFGFGGRRTKEAFLFERALTDSISSLRQEIQRRGYTPPPRDGPEEGE